MVSTVCLTNKDNSVNRNYIHSGDRIIPITGTANKATAINLSSVCYEAPSFLKRKSSSEDDYVKDRVSPQLID